MYRLLSLLITLWQWSSLVPRVSAAYTFTIQPGDEECFIIRTPKDQGAVISGNFEAIEDDVEAKELSVSLSKSSNGAILYDAPTGTREGTFRLDQSVLEENTRYSLCFQNNDSNDDEENEFDVGFSVHMSNPPRALKDGEIGPDEQRALKLVEKATAIQEDWTNMLDHYEYVRNREAIHKDMNDAILHRLMRWNRMEIFLVVGMATGQVMYWKKFFETRRYL